MARTRSKVGHAGLAAREACASGLGQLAVAYGRRKANGRANDGDAITDTVTVDDMRISAPVDGMVPAYQSKAFPLEDFAPPTTTGFGDADVDAEFRRLIARQDDDGSEGERGQEPLPWL